MFRIAITFLITAILLLPVAGAYASTQKLIVKPTPQSAESRRLSSNPVASGAQGMGQGWVNKFCGPEECMKSRWVMRNRITKMRPKVQVRSGSGAGRTYVSR